MKSSILFVMLSVIPVCHSVELTDNLSLTLDNVFDANIKNLGLEQSQINDNELFDSLLSRKFQPEPILPGWSCGAFEVAPVPLVKYRIEFLGYRESWTPLFDNYKRESVWLHAL